MNSWWFEHKYLKVASSENETMSVLKSEHAPLRADLGGHQFVYLK